MSRSCPRTVGRSCGSAYSPAARAAAVGTVESSHQDDVGSFRPPTAWAHGKSRSPPSVGGTTRAHGPSCNADARGELRAEAAAGRAQCTRAPREAQRRAPCRDESRRAGVAREPHTSHAASRVAAFCTPDRRKATVQLHGPPRVLLPVKPAVLAAYQVLQVAPWASQDEVKRAYRAKAKQHHPDVQGRDRRRVEEMARLNSARELLTTQTD